MKTIRALRLFGAMIVATLLATVQLIAQPFGQWDFNSGNLTATVGGDLTYIDGPGGATQTGTSFGTTTALGIPSINGTAANVMRFPAATGGMGFYMPTPPPNGRGSFVDNYTLILDVLYPPASDLKPRPILETDENAINTLVGTDLAVGPNNGLGLVGGTFDGTISPNTWYRIAFVVATDNVKAYINGALVGSQNAQADRLILSPNGVARLLVESLTSEAAIGYVNSIQLRDVALTGPQLQALGGPSADGIPQVIPAIPSFVVSWTPSGAASRRTTDLGVVLNPGDASVDLNSIVLKLNSVAQTGVQISSNGLITVLKTAVGPLTAGSTYTLEVSFTDSQVGAKSFSKQFKPALLFEDFEQLVLGTNVQEGLPTVYTNVWTKTPPPGWSIDDSGVPGAGDPDNDGVTEWAGWSFASNGFWGVVSDNQNRQLFTYGSGTVAVADGDEWDDAPHPRTNYMSTLLKTAPINVSGIAAGTIFMKFDSSWRPEGADDWDELGQTNNQTALITASYDGGPPIEIMRWSSLPGPNFHDDNENERVSLLLNNPAGKTNLVIIFGYLYAANDWWWAFDNVEVNIGDIPSSIISYSPLNGATNVGPRPVLTAVIRPGTTIISPASCQLLLDGGSLPVTVTTNSAGEIVVSGRALAVLPKLSSHTNTLIYSDSLSGFKTNTWTMTLADYDEIVLGTPVWREEFNGVYEGTFPAGWLATNLTTVIRTNYDLADVGSAAYENFVVVNTNRANVFNARRHQVRPATLNGQAVDALMSGNVVYGESDRRGGEQVQVLFSPVINLTGISNVKLAFNSIYEQNQDSMGAVEYSINGGATWLPVLYMIKGLENDDIITGDPVATLGTPRTDQAWDLEYGAFIGATVDASFGPYISGRVDDDQVESKRIEVHALPLAANQANVRLRFTHTGTGSWYFGIDDVGIYGDGQVNVAPTIANQPQGGAVAANTSRELVAGVSPYATRPLTFQWTRNGTNVVGATAQSYTIASMQESDAGSYRLIVGNVSGSVTSDVAVITYVVPASPEFSLNLTNSTVTQDLISTFAVSATGTAPLSYQWYFNNNAIAGATTSSLSLQHVDPTNGGSYYVVVTNNFGSKTSFVATLTVAPAPPVEITGQWDFDCASLQATAGNDLIPFNATVQADSQFGSTATFGIPNIGGSPAQVLYFAPSTASWGGYRMYHGAAPNGGGSYVNRYTIIYDVLYPVAGQWRSLLQTSTGNANDGDIFVNPGNGIGISNNYQGTVLANTWHRIAFVFDLTYNTLKKYIDGALVGTQSLDGLDGRWSLDPFALLFGDEDGDHDPTYVNSIQFRNGTLTDAQIAALGGATTVAGVPGVVPRICSAVRSGNTLTISWPAAPDIKLQKSTSLTSPVWSDVNGSLGAGSVNEPITSGPAFYRLRRNP